MSKKKKTLIIVSVALVAVGTILFGVAMTALHFDWLKLDPQKQETNIYTVTEKFENISIDVFTSDINFVLSDSQNCRVQCVENENEKHSATVENGTLKIQAIDSRNWWEHIGFFNFKKNKVTVYLPSNRYSSLSVHDNTGDVMLPKAFTFENISVSGNTGNIVCESVAEKAIHLDTSTGNITVHSNLNSALKKFSVESATGNLFFDNVIAEEIHTETSTGNISFKACDAENILMTSDTGSISGSVLSDKIFVASSSTGHINVPKTTQGTRCELTTSTGNIEVRIDAHSDRNKGSH